MPLRKGTSAGPAGAGLSVLDGDGEYDVSGLTVPLVKCAVRRAVADEAEKPKATLTFITGVGARRAFDPGHVPLRTHVLEQLRRAFEPPLVATVPRGRAEISLRDARPSPQKYPRRGRGGVESRAHTSQ